MPVPPRNTAETNRLRIRCDALETDNARLRALVRRLTPQPLEHALLARLLTPQAEKPEDDEPET